MNLFSITKNNLDEVVFEHRNKQYGAYALRKSYDEHLLKATASAFGLLLLFGSTFYVASLFGSEVAPLVKEKILLIDQVITQKIEIVPDDPLPNQSSVQNTDNMNYQIVRNEIATQPLTTLPNNNMPLNPTGELPTAGTQPGVAGGTGTAPVTVIDEAKPQFLTTVSDMPQFNGGDDAMTNYIQHHLVYPSDAMEYGKEGKVVVAFVVQTDGSITNIEILKGFGFGSEDAARKLIERMPKWIPGNQNGKLVPVQLVLPLQFQLH